MSTRLLILLLFSFSSVFSQQVIELYKGLPPGSEDWSWSEQVSTENALNTEITYNVTQPTLTAYLPPYYLATGTAVVVAPGGAFHMLSTKTEGEMVAEWLNSIGVAAFVLKYRTVQIKTDDPVGEVMGKMGDFKKLDEINAPIIELALADGIKAMEHVRENAKAYDVNPEKIGFMGFSAGGTLTLSVVYNATDTNRPNFVAPIYAYEPAVIGDQIPSAKTPIFVAAASDDQLGMTLFSTSIYEKWFKAGQPAELHLYEKGGHGFGMRTQNLPTDTWYERLERGYIYKGILKNYIPINMKNYTAKMPWPEAKLKK